MKIFEGIIVSIGMQKTAVVEITRRTPHPMYRKLIKRSKKYNVDNTGFENALVGTKVKISETRPISKNKYFKILEVVGMGQVKVEKPKEADKEILEIKSLKKAEKPSEKPVEKTRITKKTVSKKEKGETNS